MARDLGIPDDTGTWALPQKSLFPANIHIGHSQLRHLISSPAPNIVYFVDGKKIFCLDTTSRARVLVAELPFDPICTASGYGYFCAGGEKNGYFAAIRIPDMRKQEETLSRQQTGSRGHGLRSDHLEALYTNLPAPMRIERLGSQILNSISLHHLQGTGQQKVEDEVVAVLTNNDMTVRIFSLTQDKEIMKEKFAFPMNHATISPDGKLLMIVGDKEIAYFYTRIDGENIAGDGRLDGKMFQEKLWLPMRVVSLPASLMSSAYFTTAWSSNGRQCATASENGSIVLFDVEALMEPYQDPIIATIASSRPNTPAGSIRTLCFAPDPWDLLIWNEDCGRTCIADVRNGLRIRQVITLDPSLPDVKHVRLLDPSLAMSGSPAGFTDQELQILAGLRTTRQRQEESATISPRNVSHTSSPPLHVPDPAFLSYLRDYFRDQNWHGTDDIPQTEVAPLGPADLISDTSRGAATTGNSEISVPATLRSSRLARRHIDRNEAAPRAHVVAEIEAPHVPFQATTSSTTGGSSEGGTVRDPWTIIEAAMRGETTVDPTLTELLSEGTDINEATPTQPLIPTDDETSRHLRHTLANIREVNELTSGRPRYSSDALHRDYQSILDREPGWRPSSITTNRGNAQLRDHIAELEAEVDATERQLQRNNASSTPTPPPHTGPSERELLERRRRLLAIAAVSEEVGAERRRRIRSTSMTGGSNPTTTNHGFSPRRDRDGTLTTRGEAVLERQRQQRDSVPREPEPSITSPNLASDRSSVLRAFYDRSMQEISRLEGMNHDLRRRSRLGEGAGGDSGSGAARVEPELKTTGIAWGKGRSMYIGTEEGIFEITLDFGERKFWGSVEMR